MWNLQYIIFIWRRSIDRLSNLHISVLLKAFSSSSTLLLQDSILDWRLTAIPMSRSHLLQMFYKVGVLKIFAKFTGKHLCQRLFFSKLQAYRTLPVAASEWGFLIESSQYFFCVCSYFWDKKNEVIMCIKRLLYREKINLVSFLRTSYIRTHKGNNIWLF